MADDIKRAFDKLNAAVISVPKAALEAVGQLAISIITLRTRQGIDADGNRFKPYTKAYAKDRAKRNLRQSPPDLTVTGHMLGSQVPRVTGDNEVTVEFSSPREIAKAIGNSRTRDFFDVRLEQEIEAIADTVADEIVAEMLK